MKVIFIILITIFISGCGNMKKNNTGNNGLIMNEITSNNSGPENEISSSGKSEKQEGIHESFNLTKQELMEMISELPSEIKANIMNQSEDFLSLINKVLDLPYETFVLVDKEHLLSENYIPEDLVDLKNYSFVISKDSLKLRQIIISNLQEMVKDAESEGITLVLSSCYRSYETQKRTYNWNVETYGKVQADRESAQPGKSQHQLGVTLDFGTITDEYAYTPAGKWLKKNAWKYGFSLSYPEDMEWLTGYKYECWHYRHISKTGTRIEKEFFNGIQQYFLVFLNENREILLEKKY